jgi:hypothetical protein
MDVNGNDNTPEWGWCQEGCGQPAEPLWLSGAYPVEPDWLLCHQHIGVRIANLNQQWAVKWEKTIDTYSNLLHAEQDRSAVLQAEIERLRVRLAEGEAIVAEGIERMQSLRAIYGIIQARRAKGGYCLCGFQGPTFHGAGCPVGAYEKLIDGENR